jgi:K+-transporting ATPase KdpF subunit
MTGLTLIHGLAGALALGLFVYLGYALLRPENF